MSKNVSYEVMIYRIDDSHFEIFSRSVSYDFFYRFKRLLRLQCVRFVCNHVTFYFGSNIFSKFLISAHYNEDNILLYNSLLDLMV